MPFMYDKLYAINIFVLVLITNGFSASPGRLQAVHGGVQTATLKFVLSWKKTFSNSSSSATSHYRFELFFQSKKLRGTLDRNIECYAERSHILAHAKCAIAALATSET